MYYIGVDLGTSAVKLLLMEGSGKICNIVSKEYPLFFPHPGWSEQNPEDWFAQSMEGIKELTEGIDRKEVAGIGFGGQMHATRTALCLLSYPLPGQASEPYSARWYFWHYSGDVPTGREPWQE